MAVLVGYAALGVIGTIVWLAIGHPHTSAFRWGFQVGLGLAVLVGVLAPAGERRHRFAVNAAGVFIASGMVSITSALGAVVIGTHHVGRALAYLLYGLLVVAFFGGAAVLNRRMFRPERTLPPDLAAKARTLAPENRYLRAHLTLADGRQVPGFVSVGGQLIRAPKGVTAADIVDLGPAPRR